MIRALLLVSTLLIANAFAATQALTIYSVYEGARLDAIFVPFTQRTGIKVNVVFGTSQEILNRLVSEGENTPADLHLEKDMVFHSNAQKAGIYRPFESKIVEKNVPSHFIESGRNWFLMFYRSRVVMYNANKVAASEIKDYQDLGDMKWKNRVCVRTSTSNYNQALGAFFIKHFGAEKTLAMFKSWVANFAVAPIKGDTDVIKAIADGTCDVGVANSYYLAPFVRADANYPVKIAFTNQDTMGVHLNGVGLGLVKHSKNVAAATALMEYMTSTEIQAPVASAFSQYPVNPEAQVNSVLVGFGAFRNDITNIGDLTQFIAPAKEIMKAADYQ